MPAKRACLPQGLEINRRAKRAVISSTIYYLRTDPEPVVDPRDPAEVGTEPGQEHVVEVEEGEEKRGPVQTPGNYH